MVTVVNTPSPAENSDGSTLFLGVIIALVLLFVLYFFMIAPAMRSGQAPVQSSNTGNGSGGNQQTVPVIPNRIDVNLNVPTKP